LRRENYWRPLAERLLRDHDGRLGVRERSFLRSMAQWNREPTDRQWSWLLAIERQCGAGMPPPATNDEGVPGRPWEDFNQVMREATARSTLLMADPVRTLH